MRQEREIADIYVLAALRLAGIEPASVRHDGRRTVWLFEPSDALERALADYYNGRLVFPARDFAEAIRAAKGEAVHRAVV